MRNLLLFIFILVSYSAQAVKVSGRILSSNNETLPFANIYIQHSTIGTTSNSEGNYSLELEPGNYQLVFQYIGYVQKIVRITVGQENLTLNVILEEESIGLNEIVVKADAEDPAYPIIRKAIKNRKKHLLQVNEYSCDVYIKGNQKVINSPKQIFGQKIGDLGGTLDSTGTGIVYLSESLTKLYHRAPDKFKEEMLFSKFSGDDNGFSWNSARAMDFNFYKNQLEIDPMGRPFVSPIAQSALQFYKYKLEKAFYDDSGQLINKIKVSPIREADPVCSGYIYILEDIWAIQSIDVVVKKENSKIPPLEQIRFRQVHIPVEKGIYLPFSQTINFEIALFGFEFKGTFTGVYSNYDIQPNLGISFFGPELFNVQDSANKKSEDIWNSIRPIPLTQEEEADYVKKDSLQLIWSSPEYLDSLDKINNKFTLLNLFTRYTYRNSRQKWSLGIASPINTLQYNTVQGLNGGVSAKFVKTYDDEISKVSFIDGFIQYGLADRQTRGSLKISHLFNRVNFTRLGLTAGRVVQQYNLKQPIDFSVNSFYSYFLGQNHLKIYDKTYTGLEFQQEVLNGFRLFSEVSYEQRKALINSSTSTFRSIDHQFTSNDPVNSSNNTPAFLSHDAIIIRLSLRIRFGQTYIMYPKRKILIENKLPELWLHYRKGVAVSEGSPNFDHLEIEIRYDWKTGLLGFSKAVLKGGLFPNRSNVYFTDFKHFNGNQTIIARTENYLNTFQLLPYYALSTTDAYTTFHFEHHFHGFLWNKLPIIRKLGFRTVAGFHALKTTNKTYMEVNIGLENIGWNIFRFLRVDAVYRINGVYNDKWGVVVGFQLPI